MNKPIIWTVVAVLILAGGLYVATRKTPANMVPAAPQSTRPSSSSIVNPTPPTPAPVSPTPAITTLTTTLGTRSSSSLGTFLTAQSGMTLYKYAKDSSGVSTCTGQCAANWPPYTVADAASLKSDPAIAGKIATIKRADGTMQVTYNGTPLYFFSGDRAAGDTNGQNVGGVWTVVSP